uniref:Olfactory receptor n=1 Tax=Chelonoidis abingdonii TaxID=106734 RepID=A0A8C0IT16_CHEAB
ESIGNATSQRNHTVVTEFVLLGLSHSRQVQLAFFVLFLLSYVAIVLGNLLIIVTIKADSCLTSAMYFLLCNLSFIDLCYASVTSPRMLSDLLSQRNTISFNGCMAQLFLLHFVGAAEMFLLTVMAYDRYIAICKPLHYMSIMSKPTCCRLVAACWVGGFVHSIVQTILTIHLPFCGPNKIDNYFCDVPPVIRLACTNIYVTELLMISNSGLISLACFLVLLVSYTVILVTIRSAKGRRKAFSTCTSHLTVVTMLFGTLSFMYLRPSSSYALDRDMVVSVFYTMVIPMLNPLIYSLRNAEVKDALRIVIRRKINKT